MRRYHRPREGLRRYGAVNQSTSGTRMGCRLLRVADMAPLCFNLISSLILPSAKAKSLKHLVQQKLSQGV